MGAAMRACAMVLGLMLAGCAQDRDGPAERMATGAPDRDSIQADTTPDTRATGDAADEALPELAPDRMPPQLADFPLPDDIVFVEPPRHEFGRVIAVLNSQTDEEEVAALFNSQLPVHGYEITNVIVAGMGQWQFVKDGRKGVVNLDQNQLTTVIIINLFVEDAP